MKEKSAAAKIVHLLREIHIPPAYLVLPIILGLFAAMFEGAGMGLLIPILNGFLTQSFAFVLDAPVIGPIVRLLPESVLANDRLLFGIFLSAFVLAYTLRNVLRYLSSVSMAYFSLRCLHHLRKALFTKYLSFGKQFFDSTSVGHHAAVLLDFARLAFGPLQGLDRQTNALFSLVGYAVIMFSISWKLTLFALPLFVFLHFVIRALIVRIKQFSRSISERGSVLGKKSVEILSTIPLIKSNSMEQHEQQAYTQISDQMVRLDFRSRVLQELMLPMQEVITLLVATSVLIGALAIFGREQIASAPALLVYFYVVINASGKFGMLSGLRASFAYANGPLDAILEIFGQEGKFFVRGGDEEFPGLKRDIECRNLTFSYANGREVLCGVDCTFPKGKMTAVVGPTGAGKSTLIHLLMRYYDCPPGEIFIDGADVRSFSLDTYLSHVALVSQETLLLHASLRDNVAYGLRREVPEVEIRQALDQARLTEFLAKLPEGLDTLIGDRGVKLSGGEKQRLSIARALLRRAEILILDEATSSLDSQTEKLIQDAIDEAVTGRTSIVIAHRLSTIRNADKIVVLADGKKTEEGTLDELLAKKGMFHVLWEEQKF
jgi:ATP-binding cassette, subfamily B, bacterial MsbA